MAASQGCTGLGVWPYDGGDLVRVKDDYMRAKLREKAVKALVPILGGNFLALVFFFCLGKFLLEPVLLDMQDHELGECPIGSLTNTTCNDRGFCKDGFAVCRCTEGFGLYDGADCSSISPAFIVGTILLGINVFFTLNMMVMMLVGGKGAPCWFNKDGTNKSLKKEHADKISEAKRRRG